MDDDKIADIATAVGAGQPCNSAIRSIPLPFSYAVQTVSALIHPGIRYMRWCVQPSITPQLLCIFHEDQAGLSFAGSAHNPIYFITSTEHRQPERLFINNFHRFFNHFLSPQLISPRFIKLSTNVLGVPSLEMSSKQASKTGRDFLFFCRQVST